MILDTVTKRLQIVLGEAHTTSPCKIVAAYAETSATSFVGGNTNANSNGVTPVTVVDVPSGPTVCRDVREVRVFNADTVAHTVTLQLFDGTNTWIIGPSLTTVAAGKSFVYTPESGSGPGGPPGPPSVLGPTLGWEAATPIYAGTFTYTQYASQAATLTALKATVGGSGGSVTATVAINGVAVTGINGVTVNSPATQNFSASGANTISTGDKITLILVIASGAPAGAVFTILVVGT